MSTITGKLQFGILPIKSPPTTNNQQPTTSKHRHRTGTKGKHMSTSDVINVVTSNIERNGNGAAAVRAAAHSQWLKVGAHVVFQ
ncbi:hypothetical protein ACFU99_00145 [Streptomyces sp. NPDC057654]|uniref:hypothetical protein n=1 Tax=Streptomyces sp. NPDC057654 TaxID=3346196 RepID=UPI0036C74416